MGIWAWFINAEKRLSLRSRLLKAILPKPPRLLVVDYEDPTEEDASSSAKADKCQQDSEILVDPSPLLQLPPELLLNIMLHLPNSSIYMLHQTSRRFRGLSHNAALKDFRLETLQSEPESYCITEAGFEQLRIIRNILLRTHLCTKCALLADSGELVRRMRSFWEPEFCSSCHDWHPAFFFPTNPKQKASCLGAIGHFAVCEHYKLSTELQRIKPGGPPAGFEERFTCKDREHLYTNFSKGTNCGPHYCAPTFGISRHIPFLNYVHVQRDLCLLRVAYHQTADMQNIRTQLDKQLQSCRYLCKHFADQKDLLLECMTSSHCTCFPLSGLSSGPREVPRLCENHTYCCRHCGTLYSWIHHLDTSLHRDSYITLRVTNKWFYYDRLSFGWVANLDFETTEHPILNEETKGVLWCDDTNCGTGCGRRWVRMIKMYRYQTSNILSNKRSVELFKQGPSNMEIEDINPLSLEYETFDDVARWLPSVQFDGYRNGRPRYLYRYGARKTSLI